MTFIYYQISIVCDDDRNSHRWVRNRAENLEYDSRNRSSTWKNTNELESTRQGLCIKFGMDSLACGALFPIVIVYSGLTKEEMPEDEFNVIPIPGLTINAHLNIRNDDIGYISYVRSGCKQVRF